MSFLLLSYGVLVLNEVLQAFIGVCGSCVFRRIPNCQWAETGGSGIYPSNPSPTSIRNDTYFSEEKHVKITTLFKISSISSEICDILKHALATHSWQCRGSGQLQLLPNHHNGFYGYQRVI